MPTPSTVSIIISSYNYGEYIASAVKSAMSQTLRPIEVIVVDDGSTDGSVLVLEQFKDVEGFQLHSQANAGQVAAYNKGFANATGDIVIFLDSDDVLDLNVAEEARNAFADPAVVKFHWKMRLIDTKGVETGALIPSVLDSGDFGEALRLNGTLYNSAPGSGNAYRRDAISRLFPLPTQADDKHGADLFVIYGVAFFGKIASAPKPLGCYRVHFDASELSGQLTFGNAAKSHHIVERNKARLQLFQAWMSAKFNVHFETARLFDFSTIRTEFVVLIFEKKTWLGRVQQAIDLSPMLLRGILSRKDFGMVKSAAWCGWAFLVAALPRAAAVPLATFVSNPEFRPTFIRNMS